MFVIGVGMEYAKGANKRVLVLQKTKLWHQRSSLSRSEVQDAMGKIQAAHLLSATPN